MTLMVVLFLEGNKNKVRVTSGVELNFRDAISNEEQIDDVIKKLKTILHLKNKLTKLLGWVQGQLLQIVYL